MNFVFAFIRNAIHVLTGAGPCCRFTPTCSAFGVEAMKQHGLWRGTILLLGRLWRCRPGAEFGCDPVPMHFLGSFGKREGAYSGR